MRNLTDQERVCIAFLRSIGYSRQDVADILSRGTRTVTRTTGEFHFTKQERKNTKTIQQVLEKIRTNDTDDLERPMPGQQVFDEFREPEPEDDRLKLVVGEKPREKKHITFAEAYAAYEKAGLCGAPVPQLWVDYIKQEGFLPADTEKDIIETSDGMYEKRIYDAVEPHTNYLRDLIRGIVREEMGVSG